MATKKPEIQYVGQFYVYGSEAQAVAVKKRPQFQLLRFAAVNIELTDILNFRFAGHKKRLPFGFT